MSGMNFDDQVRKYMDDVNKNKKEGGDSHKDYFDKLRILLERTNSEGLRLVIKERMNNHKGMSDKQMDDEYEKLKKAVDNRDDDCGMGCTLAKRAGIILAVVIVLVIIAVVLYFVLKKKTENFNTVRSDVEGAMNDSVSNVEKFGAFIERGPSVPYPDPYIKYNYYDDSYDKSQSQFDDNKFCDADDSEDSMQDAYSVGRIVQPVYL